MPTTESKNQSTGRDLRAFFGLLSTYLHSLWGRVVAGVLLGMIAQGCSLRSPFLTRYLIDVVITQKRYALLNNILLISADVLISLLVSSLSSSAILEFAFKQVSVHLKEDVFFSKVDSTFL